MRLINNRDTYDGRFKFISIIASLLATAQILCYEGRNHQWFNSRGSVGSFTPIQVALL